MVSLEMYQLFQLTIRLLPPYCIITFSVILLIMRTRIGLKKTHLDNLALQLIEDGSNGYSRDGWSMVMFVDLLAYILLAFGIILMTVVFLQIAGLTWPAWLFQFYPNYQSHELKKKRASNSTIKYLHTTGCIVYGLSFLLGFCICFSTRLEITKEKKLILYNVISQAMLGYHLGRLNNIFADNGTKGTLPARYKNSIQNDIDQIQTTFSCCGLNSFEDYTVRPKPKNSSWEDALYYGKRLISQHHLSTYPTSCCVTTSTGDERQCTATNQMHNIGCYTRLLQFIRWRQTVIEHWNLYIGACVALTGGMAYWVQIM